MKKYKYIISRRVTQSAVLLLFIAGNIYGWSFLRGNLSSARLMDVIPLSDPFAVLQITASGTRAARDAVIGALIVGGLYAMIGGRIFCGWVCPVNIITDTANKLGRIFRFDTQLRSWRFKRGIRYWILGLSFLLSAILGVAAFEWISPIGMLHRGIIYGMGFGWSFAAIVFLIDLFAAENGFCGHICPLGGFYALIGRYGFLRIGYNRQKCTLCMKCVDICPEKQVLSLIGEKSGPVLSGECINCGRCIEVCNDDAVKFKNIYSSQLITRE